MKNNVTCAFSHVALFVKNMEVSKDFYVNKLGFDVIYEDINHPTPEITSKICYIKLHELTLELVERTDYQPRETGKFDHITIYVKNIEKAVEFLKAQGINTMLWEEPHHINHFFGGKGAHFMFFLGPDGERIEFEEQHAWA